VLSERMARVVANARLVRIPACGHSSSLEQPQAVIEAMREMMAKPLAANSR
jgi:pimeloyl-ACP methyl ester carboxylesterase